jgi:hypothetical protein
MAYHANDDFSKVGEDAIQITQIRSNPSRNNADSATVKAICHSDEK